MFVIYHKFEDLVEYVAVVWVDNEESLIRFLHWIIHFGKIQSTFSIMILFSFVVVYFFYQN